MKLIIERDKWLRGEGSEQSKLLRTTDEKMCCLGFFSLACGLKREDIIGVASPEEICVVSDVEEWPAHEAKFLFNDSSHITENISVDCVNLMEENDDLYRTDAEREEKIAAIFASNGVEVEFV